MNPHELDVIQRAAGAVQGRHTPNIPRDANVLDVGAYTGNWSLELASRLPEATRVLAYEPHPRVRETLHARLQSHRGRHREHPAHNVEVNALAMSDEPGASLELVDRMDGLASARHDLVDGDNTVQARTTTIDEAVKNLGHVPKLIKVDVEGYELPVLDGAAELLAKNANPVWVVETHDGLMSPWQRFTRRLDGLPSIREQVRRRFTSNGYQAATLRGPRRSDHVIAYGRYSG